MRANPTALEQSGAANDYSVGGKSNVTCSAVPIFNNTYKDAALVELTVSSGLSGGDASHARFTDDDGFFGFSAEL